MLAYVVWRFSKYAVSPFFPGTQPTDGHPKRVFLAVIHFKLTWSYSWLLFSFEMLNMQNTEASKCRMENIFLWLCQHLASLFLECVFSVSVYS